MNPFENTLELENYLKRTPPQHRTLIFPEPPNSVEVFDYNTFDTNKCYQKCNRVDNIIYRNQKYYCPITNLTYLGRFTHLSQGNPNEGNFSVGGPINLTAKSNKYFRECPCRIGGTIRKRRKRTCRR